MVKSINVVLLEITLNSSSCYHHQLKAKASSLIRSIDIEIILYLDFQKPQVIRCNIDDFIIKCHGDVAADVLWLLEVGL